MNALDIVLAAAWVALLALAFILLERVTRPAEGEDELTAEEWDALAAGGPGPFIVADGPQCAAVVDDSWIEDAVLNHPAVDASYDDHVARAMAIIEWPTHPAYRQEFSDTHLARLVETWGGEQP